MGNDALLHHIRFDGIWLASGCRYWKVKKVEFVAADWKGYASVLLQMRHKIVDGSHDI